MGILHSLLLAGAFFSTAFAEPDCVEHYTVKPYDSCWKISIEKSVALKNLIAWNQHRGNCALYPGDVLCVAKYKVQCNRTHMVISNDWCWKIAKDNDIDLNKLVALNPNLVQSIDECNIHPGQQVCVG
ncbi:hypothetical protein XA68_12654 [Ophiocordyceps unilateralis]|uniref:LysM domain-containing protein n=1 Tax=Ophiocordyceps unilateralis TaxID=268505 RepID=A0A2A9PE95_OPHUN|nr:hypothetical protein XA68_12654 [Ophiocordyceps unilateralis]